MVTWPSSIPQTPVLGNYSETFTNQTVISNLSGGPTERRRRTVINTYPIDVVFKMNKTQATTFVNFYKTSVHYGASLFTWTHPVTGATISAHFITAPQLTAETFDWYSIKVALQIVE